MDVDTLIYNLQAEADGAYLSSINMVNSLLSVINKLEAERDINFDPFNFNNASSVQEVAVAPFSGGLSSPPSPGSANVNYPSEFKTTLARMDPSTYPGSLTKPTLNDYTTTEPTGLTAPSITWTDFSDTSKPPPILTEAEVDPSTAFSNFNTYFTNDTSLIKSAVRDWVDTYAPDFSAALAQLESAVMEGIESGTGLTEAVEYAMLNRKRQTLDRERIALEQQAAKVETARGGDVVQPSFFAALRNIGAKHSDQIAVSSNEVFLWRSQMEIEYRKTCMQLSAQIQSTILNELVAWGSLFTQYRNALIQYEIAVLNAKVLAHNAKMQADVQVYGTNVDKDLKVYSTAQVRPQIEADIFKTQLGTETQVYSTQTDKEAKIYSADIQRIGYLADLQKTEVMADVQVYGSQLDTDAKVYAASFQRSGQQVEAYKATAAAQTENYRAQASALQARVQAYAAEWNSKVEARKIALGKGELELKGKISENDAKNLKNRLQAELNQRALESSAQAYSAAANMLGQIAAAAQSVISGIAVAQVNQSV